MKIIEFLQMLNSAIFLLFAAMLIMNMHWKNPQNLTNLISNLEEMEGNSICKDFINENNITNDIENAYSHLNTYNKLLEIGYAPKSLKIRSENWNKIPNEPKKIVLYSLFAAVFLGLGAIYKLGIMFKMQTF